MPFLDELDVRAILQHQRAGPIRLTANGEDSLAGRKVVSLYNEGRLAAAFCIPVKERFTTDPSGP